MAIVETNDSSDINLINRGISRTKALKNLSRDLEEFSDFPVDSLSEIDQKPQKVEELGEASSSKIRVLEGFDLKIEKLKSRLSNYLDPRAMENIQRNYLSFETNGNRP